MARPAPDAPDSDVLDSDVLDSDVLAGLVADAVTGHPSVARLDGGVFGTVATYLPGRRLVGVRIGQGAEPVEIGVVVHLDRRIPDVAADLRRAVSALCGGAAVDITVSDVVVPGREPGPPVT